MHVLSHLDPQYGGLSAAVPALAAAIASGDSCSSEIAAFCTPEELTSPAPPHVALTRWPGSRSAWLRDRTLVLRFREQMKYVDGVHIHGLWEQSTLIAARTAHALGKPYVLSAHGMLDSWALANKRAKKLLYAALIERAIVARAGCLHALTPAEAGDYRRFGSRAPIAIIPNGVTVPVHTSPEPFLDAFPELRHRRLLLFLGRIHYKKGVDLLVRAWAQLAASAPEAHLVLAGPDFEGTQAPLEALVRELGLASRVTFTGMLRGSLKWSALAAAQLFLLPSLSEGFSVSALEAMGMGLPVIVSEACHLSAVEEVFAGWTTQSEVSSLSSSMQKFLNNSPQANREIGSRGRRLVKERFTWPAIAGQMTGIYRWQGGGPPPTQIPLHQVKGTR